MCCRNDFKQFTDLALEKIAKAFDGGKLHPRSRLVVKRSDGAAIQASPLSHVRDAEFVAPHEEG